MFGRVVFRINFLDAVVGKCRCSVVSLAVADLVGSVHAPVVLDGGVLDVCPDLLR